MPQQTAWFALKTYVLSSPFRHPYKHLRMNVKSKTFFHGRACRMYTRQGNTCEIYVIINVDVLVLKSLVMCTGGNELFTATTATQAFLNSSDALAQLQQLAAADALEVCISASASSALSCIKLEACARPKTCRCNGSINCVSTIAQVPSLRFSCFPNFTQLLKNVCQTHDFRAPFKPSRSGMITSQQTKMCHTSNEDSMSAESVWDKNFGRNSSFASCRTP